MGPEISGQISQLSWVFVALVLFIAVALNVR